jgi:glycosyltransferase involved in cell wall biosynthesis
MICYFVDEIQSSFVINDIKRIANKYEAVYLFSVEKLEGKEALPNNVIVCEEFIDWKNYKPLKILTSNLFTILSIYFKECIALKTILHFKKSIALLSSNIFKAECIIKKLKSINPHSSLTPIPQACGTSSLIAYSFWFYDCIYLAWMRKKGWVNKAISRAHGGDLFEERGSLGKILFRNFQIKYLDQVYSVSKSGENYLKDKYTFFSNKISTSYLGSQDYGLNDIFNKYEPFVIVSCAKVRNIKRIHKIAEMLQYIDFPITWVHLGDENLNAKNDSTIPVYLENKIKLSSKNNVQFIAKGLMDNDSIIKFYQNNTIHLFISLSEAEGVPVSMMEAISFGIPVLSTNVGGCKEIVTEETGLLIPLETEMQEIAKIITEFKDSEKNTQEFRKGVRKYWEQYFDADKNYGAFVKHLN